MTKLIHILFLSFVVLATSCTDQTEENNVRAAFDSYKSDIMNDKGEDAVKYVDSKTIGYYSDMLELAKNANPEQINSLSLIDKLMVFSVRHRASKEDILSFDGKGLLVYAIESGMVGKGSVESLTIGKVTINGDSAKGQFVINGEEVPYYFEFNKEDGQWKVDLTSIFSMSKEALDQTVASSGMDENEYIFVVLEAVSGTKPGEEIWETVE